MYYYYPDSPPLNHQALKKEIETIFARADMPMVFQPFSHIADLERLLIEMTPAFLLVPKDYARHYQARFNANPSLNSLRAGSLSYEKVLLYSSKLNFSLDKLAGSTIAMTNTAPDGYDLLKKLAKDAPGLDCSKSRIVHVPQDADAILALALGEVDLALVTKINLNLIKDFSADLEKQLIQFPKSIEVPMPVLCSMDGKTSPEELDKLLKILLPDNEELSEKLNLDILQISGWQKI